MDKRGLFILQFMSRPQCTPEREYVFNPFAFFRFDQKNMISVRANSIFPGVQDSEDPEGNVAYAPGDGLTIHLGLLGCLIHQYCSPRRNFQPKKRPYDMSYICNGGEGIMVMKIRHLYKIKYATECMYVRM